MDTRDISFPFDKPHTEYSLVESSVREGNAFELNQVLYTVKAFDRNNQQTTIVQIKAECDGQLLEDFCCVPGSEVEPGMILARIKTCSHAVVLAGLCSACGKALTSESGLRKVVVGGLNKTLHLSEAEFGRWSEKHNKRLMAEKRLVLVLDLDNTLLETFCAAKRGKGREDLGRSLGYLSLLETAKMQVLEGTPVLQSFGEELRRLAAEPSSDATTKAAEKTLAALEQTVREVVKQGKLVAARTRTQVLRLPSAAVTELLDGKTRDQVLQALDEHGAAVPFQMSGTGTTYFAKPRPYAKQMLCSLVPLFHLYVYTLGRREYANKVLELLGLGKLLPPSAVVCAEDSADIAYKDLARAVQCDERFVVIVDDRADVWERSLSNLVRVQNYFYWKECFFVARLVQDLFAELCLGEGGCPSELRVAATQVRDKATLAALAVVDANEEKTVRLLAGRLEKLHSAAYTDRPAAAVDVRPLLDGERRSLFANKRVFILYTRPLRVHEKELHSVGALAGGPGLLDCDFWAVVKTDAAASFLADRVLDSTHLRKAFLENKPDLPVFVYYDWFEHSIGNAAVQPVANYVLDTKDVLWILDTAAHLRELQQTNLEKKEQESEDNIECELERELGKSDYFKSL